MKTTIFITWIFCVFTTSLFSQSNINQTLSVNTTGAIAEPSAQLDVSATDKGMLVPRMNSTQRTAIASPATGLLVFDTDSNTFWFYSGMAWSNLSGGGSGVPSLIADNDNDTKVQVEKNPNEDIIRFDLGGTESMVLQKNSSGSPRLELPNAAFNTFIGQGAGAATSMGNSNTAIGYEALNADTYGYKNTAIGLRALYSNNGGPQNTAIGGEALYNNTTGFINPAVGNYALHYNTTGNLNSALGYISLYSNTTGYYNTATGAGALYSNTSGSENTANGAVALSSNTTGDANIACGMQALYSNTAGYNNTANGVSALFTNTTGFSNTAMGFSSDVASNNLANATVIGAYTTVNTSNKVRIGNSSVTVIEGQVDWTFPSDARFKFNIHDDAVPGLAFIEKLRPVTYQFDTRKFDEHLMQNMPDSIQERRMAAQDYSKSSAIIQTGFLAQEVEQACKDLNFQFSGLHVPESEVDNYGLAYGSFVPLLVKAIQEQQTQIEALKAENERLKNVETRLAKITAALQSTGITVEE